MAHRFEDKINSAVCGLLDNYSEGKTIDKVLTFDHPDREHIIDIIKKLRHIIMAGYFKSEGLRVYTLENNLRMLLEDVIFNLVKQISVCLVYGTEKSITDAEIIEKAETITFQFVDKLPMIREYIETDVLAAYDGDPAAYSTDEIIFTYPGLFAILVNRIAHELYALKVPMLPRIMTEYAHSVTGIDIHPGAVIGKYFFIDHGTGIVIGETTVIGNNVKIYQGVTLGALSTRGGQALRSKKRHPTICDNVTIYAGASILGGDTVVGEGVVVGGNAFIINSIPDGAKVSIKNQELAYNYDSENPPQRMEIEADDEWFYVI